MELWPTSRVPIRARLLSSVRHSVGIEHAADLARNPFGAELSPLCLAARPVNLVAEAAERPLAGQSVEKRLGKTAAECSDTVASVDCPMSATGASAARRGSTIPSPSTRCWTGVKRADATALAALLGPAPFPDNVGQEPMSSRVRLTTRHASRSTL